MLGSGQERRRKRGGRVSNGALLDAGGSAGGLARCVQGCSALPTGTDMSPELLASRARDREALLISPTIFWGRALLLFGPRSLSHLHCFTALRPPAPAQRHPGPRRQLFKSGRGQPVQLSQGSRRRFGGALVSNQVRVRGLWERRVGEERGANSWPALGAGAGPLHAPQRPCGTCSSCSGGRRAAKRCGGAGTNCTSDVAL